MIFTSFLIPLTLKKYPFLGMVDTRYSYYLCIR